MAAELQEEVVGFSGLAGLIQAALDAGGNTHSVEDILTGIRDNRFQWWPGLNSFVVTQIIDHPQKRVCHVFLAGGNLEEIRAIRTWIAHWAVSVGCRAATITGRPGWEKELKGEGWRRTAVELELNLEADNGVQ